MVEIGSGKTDNDLLKKYLKIKGVIEKRFNKSILKDNIEIHLQSSNSEIQIPQFGSNFGLIKENNSLIFANWFDTLSRNERRVLVDFLLTREVFWNIFEIENLPNDHSILIEKLLNLLAIIWLTSELKQKSIHHRNMGFIIQRQIFGLDQKIIFQWKQIMLAVYYSNVNLDILFQRIGATIKDALIDRFKPDILEKKFLDWVDSLKPIDDALYFPIKMKQRHFDVLKCIMQLNYAQSTARKIGDKLQLKHDAINYAFHEIKDLHLLYWVPRINFLALKLYPYTIRLMVNTEEAKNELLKVLVKNPYIFNLFEAKYKDGFFIFASLNSPHIVCNNLAEKFEKYKKSNQISDYFLQAIRRRRVFGSVTTRDFSTTEKSIENIFSDPASFDIATYNFIDENFYPLHDKQSKKVFFNYEVLGFLSLLRVRFLPQGQYGFHATEFIEFCKKHDVNPSNLAETMNYINKLERRCIRLNLLEYKLTSWVKSMHTTNVYYEIFSEPNDKRISELVNKLKSFASLTVIEFSDRVFFVFQGITYDQQFFKMVKKQIEKADLSFNEFNAVKNVDFNRCICLHELYDQEGKCWKFKKL